MTGLSPSPQFQAKFVFATTGLSLQKVTPIWWTVPGITSGEKPVTQYLWLVGVWRVILHLTFLPLVDTNLHPCTDIHLILGQLYLGHSQGEHMARYACNIGTRHKKIILCPCYQSMLKHGVYSHCISANTPTVRQVNTLLLAMVSNCHYMCSL